MRDLNSALDLLQKALDGLPFWYEHDDEGELVLYTSEEQYQTDEGNKSESLKKTRVVRGGKKVWKWKTDREGYKVVWRNGRPKEIRIRSKERINRKKGLKKTLRKSKSKRSRANLRRKKSLRVKI